MDCFLHCITRHVQLETQLVESVILLRFFQGPPLFQRDGRCCNSPNSSTFSGPESFLNCALFWIKVLAECQQAGHLGFRAARTSQSEFIFHQKLRQNCETRCSDMSHVATCLATLRKVDDCSTFSATCNATFCCVASCREGMSHAQFFLQLVSQQSCETSCRKCCIV